MNYTYKAFAAATYSSDTYGSGAYQEVQGASTITNTSTPLLANTGYDVLIPVSLGLAIIIASAIVLVKKLRTKKQS